MKAKIFFGGALAALVLGMTACAIDEVVQTNPILEDTDGIAFKATLGHSTRAAAVTSNQLKEFSVWGWNGDGMFMSHERYYAEGAYYESDSLYLWPSIGANFVALLPVVDEEANSDGTSVYLGGEVEADDVAKSDKYYTGHFAQATIDANGGAMEIKVDTPADNADQVDLCYAVAMDNPSGSYVTLNFRHALSQVVFKAKNTNPDMTVDIAGVSLCSVSKTGQYTLPLVNTVPNLDGDNGTTEPAAGTQGTWTVGDPITESVFAGGMKEDHVSLSTDTTRVSLLSDSGALFLIPQKTDGWDVENDHYQKNGGAYFRVKCRIAEFGSQLWPSNAEGAGEYAEIAMPVDIDWEEGYRYTYTFIFGYGAGYYPPDDPNDPENGTGATPVLNIVNFSVSVDEFQDAVGDYDIWTDTEEEDEGEEEPEPEPAPIEITLLNSSSSTLTFEWSLNESLEETIALGYNIELFEDEACENLWVSWLIDNTLYRSTSSSALHDWARFTFTGLDAGKDYWVRLTATEDATIYSNPFHASTTTFDYVVSENTTAEVGDVLVAEDFHGFIHGGDVAFNAIGISTSANANRATYEISKGMNPTDYAKPVAQNTEFNIFTASSVGDAYRQGTGLDDWCTGNDTNCSTRPGYAKLGGGSGALGYLATPVLSTIPEGSYATVKVQCDVLSYNEDTASGDYGRYMQIAAIDMTDYEVANHQVVGWETTSDDSVPVDAVVLDIQSAIGGDNADHAFYPFEATLTGVTNNCRIRFVSDPAKYNGRSRFLLDNIVITVTDIEEGAPEPEPDTINISLVEATSSTITVEWDYNGATDFTKIYNAGLWMDANRSNQWVIWTINDLSVWTGDSYQLQRFTFTGLDAGTTYYCRIEWADDTSIHSDTIAITTPTFDHTVSTNSVAQAGDVLVAEDFHGLIHGGDIGRRALGVSESGSVRETYVIPRGTNPWDDSGRPVKCSTEWNVFTGSSDSYLQATGLYDWCMGTGTNASTRPGYIKIGGGSAWGYLATPVLSTIPEGKTATVKVDFSAMSYTQSSSEYGGNVMISVVDNAEVTNHQADGWTTSSDSAEPVDYEIINIVNAGASGLNMKFMDFSTTLTGVSNVSRIRFSSNTTAAVNNKVRFLLDNVVVTVVSIDEDEPAGRTEEVVYFEDDLDWLEPYAEAVGQADVVATGNNLTDANGNTFSTTYIANASVNGVSAADALRERGYSFLLPSGSEDSYVVIMPGYLYVYANNANHIGSIHLPALEQVPAEGDPVWIDLKWCPGASSSLNLNNINLVVVVKNGDTETQFEVGETTSVNKSLHWDSVSLELKDVTFDANTEIIIRPTDEYWNATDTSNHCWFIDDFKIYTPAD